jgi:hypothetical protein
MNTVAQVELDSLLAAGAGALVAGLAVTLAYALALRGLIEAADRRREGRPGSALVGALGGVALLVGLGGVIAGLVIVAGR